MYPFAPSVTPAVRTHLDAQISFANDLSKSFFRSFQHVCDLNIQLAQTLLEEVTVAGHTAITHERPTEALSAASARAQPAADKLRAYQQSIARVAAGAQVDLARVTEQHVKETTRTARALADEVEKAAAEEAEHGLRAQQETMRGFTDPFKHIGAGMRGNGDANQMSGADSFQQAAAQATQAAKSGAGARKDA